jgi:hypothetical protein
MKVLVYKFSSTEGKRKNEAPADRRFESGGQ